MFLLVFAQVDVLQYVRSMLMKAAMNESKKPFDPRALDKLVQAHPVVQEAVVHYSHQRDSNIEYPDSLVVSCCACLTSGMLRLACRALFGRCSCASRTTVILTPLKWCL